MALLLKARSTATVGSVTRHKPHHATPVPPVGHPALDGQVVALRAGQVAITLAGHQAGVAVAVPAGNTHHGALQEGHAYQAGEQGLQGKLW